MKINERLQKISKKIIGEYLWVSKEDYPSMPNFGSNWKETEKGWSTGTEDVESNYTDKEVSYAISSVAQAGKYDELADELVKEFELSIKMNLAIDMYSKIENKMLNFTYFDENSKKEYKKLSDKLEEYAEIINSRHIHNVLMVMDKLSIKNHMSLGQVDVYKPPKQEFDNDYQIFSDSKKMIFNVCEHFCKMFSQKYNFGNLEIYISDKVLRSEYRGDNQHLNISAEKELVSELVSNKLKKKTKEKQTWSFSLGSFVHEMAHHMEKMNKHINDRCREFLEYRTQGEAFVALNDLFFEDTNISEHVKQLYPDGPYDWSEQTRIDSFFDPYCGKFYSDGSTEIFSQGLQKLLENPVEFKKTDPEYFYFIIALMRGEL